MRGIAATVAISESGMTVSVTSRGRDAYGA
jgi:hypothetical protein